MGLSHPKTMLRKTKPPCTNVTMLNFSCKKGYMKLCYLGNVVVLLVQLSSQDSQFPELKSFAIAQ